MATFPYNPTRVLSWSSSADVIYILQPATSASGLSQLLALNVSNTLSTTNLPYAIISPTLPFLQGSQNNAYTPAIDDGGNILVYTGTCEGTAQVAALWQFTPLNGSSTLNGTWKKLDMSLGGTNGYNALDGANYLASAIAFSTAANATSEMYVFGGMCPNTTSSTADDWTRAAVYSNSMLTIDSPQSSIPSAPAYDLGISSSRGPPIAEAGFTITPLQPTFFNSGNSNETQPRNQNFVLLGGHTQQAFINMSQIALFSLPEQSWSFLPVDSPSQEPNTDLAARYQTTVDSRSGHTALLTSDGKRLIVLGGWVGDVTTSADPQLAVLELGAGYGGSGDWQWSIPNPIGPGLGSRSGIYGHGAAMLPGDVMMVVGGYQIPASGGPRRKRANPPLNNNAYFFNTTSNTWLASYTHPKVSIDHGTSKTAGSNTDVAKKVGLGAGLTLWILAVIAVIVLYFWYSRRLKRRRDAREAELRNSAIGTHRIQLSGPGQHHHGQGTNELATVDSARDSHQYPRSGCAEPEAERTGLLFEIPSPTRGLRRSLHSRGTYQPSSRFDDGRRTPGFSTIHPIDERDEYEEEPLEGGSGQREMIQREDYNILTNVPVLDPFRDYLTGSRTPSPQSPQERELEIRNWVNDWTAADALMHHNAGRLSPERNDRTSSTLSDQSARSGLSSHSVQQSVGSISRSMSQRSAALFSSAPFRSTNDTSPFDNQHSPTQRYSPEHQRSRSLTLPPAAQRSNTADTYATATTSFPQLQSEGEALLGDYPGAGGPSPTRSHSRARAWMGSVRRALTGIERSASTSPENDASTSSSPTKRNYTEGGLPRRAASTGGMLWQKRQGAKDWDVDNAEQRGEKSSYDEHDATEDEWDVESAVERRVVQVMFTVPKEKLRVVNRGPDGDDESILSSEIKEADNSNEDHDKEKGKGKA